MEIVELVAGPGHPNGLAVPAEALELLVDLDIRGMSLTVHKGDQLRVARKDGQGAPELTDGDREAITRWKIHLLALVAYCQ